MVANNPDLRPPLPPSPTEEKHQSPSPMYDAMQSNDIIIDHLNESANDLQPQLYLAPSMLYSPTRSASMLGPQNGAEWQTTELVNTSMLNELQMGNEAHQRTDSVAHDIQQHTDAAAATQTYLSPPAAPTTVVASKHTSTNTTHIANQSYHAQYAQPAQPYTRPLHHEVQQLEQELSQQMPEHRHSRQDSLLDQTAMSSVLDMHEHDLLHASEINRRFGSMSMGRPMSSSDDSQVFSPPLPRAASALATHLHHSHTYHSATTTHTPHLRSPQRGSRTARSRHVLSPAKHHKRHTPSPCSLCSGNTSADDIHSDTTPERRRSIHHTHTSTTHVHNHVHRSQSDNNVSAHRHHTSTATPPAVAPAYGPVADPGFYAYNAPSSMKELLRQWGIQHPLGTVPAATEEAQAVQPAPQAARLPAQQSQPHHRDDVQSVIDSQFDTDSDGVSQILESDSHTARSHRNRSSQRHKDAGADEQKNVMYFKRSKSARQHRQHEHRRSSTDTVESVSDTDDSKQSTPYRIAMEVKRKLARYIKLNKSKQDSDAYNEYVRSVWKQAERDVRRSMRHTQRKQQKQSQQHNTNFAATAPPQHIQYQQHQQQVLHQHQQQHTERQYQHQHQLAMLQQAAEIEKLKLLDLQQQRKLEQSKLHSVAIVQRQIEADHLKQQIELEQQFIEHQLKLQQQQHAGQLRQQLGADMNVQLAQQNAIDSVLIQQATKQLGRLTMDLTPNTAQYLLNQHVPAAVPASVPVLQQQSAVVTDANTATKHSPRTDEIIAILKQTQKKLNSMKKPSAPSVEETDKHRKRDRHDRPATATKSRSSSKAPVRDTKTRSRSASKAKSRTTITTKSRSRSKTRVQNVGVSTKDLDVHPPPLLHKKSILDYQSLALQHSRSHSSIPPAQNKPNRMSNTKQQNVVMSAANAQRNTGKPSRLTNNNAMQADVQQLDDIINNAVASQRIKSPVVQQLLGNNTNRQFSFNPPQQQQPSSVRGSYNQYTARVQQQPYIPPLTQMNSFRQQQHASSRVHVEPSSSPVGAEQVISVSDDVAAQIQTGQIFFDPVTQQYMQVVEDDDDDEQQQNNGYAYDQNGADTLMTPIERDNQPMPSLPIDSFDNQAAQQYQQNNRPLSVRVDGDNMYANSNTIGDRANQLMNRFQSQIASIDNNMWQHQ